MTSAFRTNVTSQFAAFLVAAMFSGVATAFDGISFEYGQSDRHNEVDRYGAAVKLDMPWRLFDTGSIHLGTYLEAGVNYWDSENGVTGTDSLVDFHLTPVFRLAGNRETGIMPHFEFGLGVHGHTESEIEDEDFDIPFAFGSHVGVGLRFGQRQQYELLYRYQHLSNAGLGDENPGINFHFMQVGYRF